MTRKAGERSREADGGGKSSEPRHRKGMLREAGVGDVTAEDGTKRPGLHGHHEGSRKKDDHGGSGGSRKKDDHGGSGGSRKKGLKRRKRSSSGSDRSVRDPGTPDTEISDRASGASVPVADRDPREPRGDHERKDRRVRKGEFPDGEVRGGSPRLRREKGVVGMSRNHIHSSDDRRGDREDRRSGDREDRRSGDREDRHWDGWEEPGNAREWRHSSGKGRVVPASVVSLISGLTSLVVMLAFLISFLVSLVFLPVTAGLCTCFTALPFLLSVFLALVSTILGSWSLSILPVGSPRRGRLPAITGLVSSGLSLFLALFVAIIVAVVLCVLIVVGIVAYIVSQLLNVVPPV